MTDIPTRSLAFHLMVFVVINEILHIVTHYCIPKCLKNMTLQRLRKKSAIILSVGQYTTFMSPNLTRSCTKKI